MCKWKWLWKQPISNLSSPGLGSGCRPPLNIRLIMEKLPWINWISQKTNSFKYYIYIWASPSVNALHRDVFMQMSRNLSLLICFSKCVFMTAWLEGHMASLEIPPPFFTSLVSPHYFSLNHSPLPAHLSALHAPEHLHPSIIPHIPSSPHLYFNLAPSIHPSTSPSCSSAWRAFHFAQANWL